jgi:2-keto-myo-inositol isomerase
MLSFALNHMSVPGLRYDQVLQLAGSLDCVGVEFRNDLPGPLFAGDAPQAVNAALRDAGLRCLALAEVKSFNDWSDQKRAEAATLIATAAACGAEAVALIPRNDGKGMGNGERQANLRVALRELAPMLADAGLIGLVEPLGFEICALRYKSEAVDAIEALGHADRFKLVHDTFHHHLAGGGPLFPAHTGIVHISGVVDPALATSEMRDEHRVLVDVRDRLGNLDQIEALREAGYRGPISVEAFAPEVHALDDPGAELAASFEFIRSRLKAEAA